MQTWAGQKTGLGFAQPICLRRVIKHQRKQRTGKVEHRILWGDEQSYRYRLKQAGLTGRLITSFIEHANKTRVPGLYRQENNPLEFLQYRWLKPG